MRQRRPVGNVGDQGGEAEQTMQGMRDDAAAGPPAGGPSGEHPAVIGLGDGGGQHRGVGLDRLIELEVVEAPPPQRGEELRIRLLRGRVDEHVRHKFRLSKRSCRCFLRSPVQPAHSVGGSCTRSA